MLLVFFLRVRWSGSGVTVALQAPHNICSPPRCARKTLAARQTFRYSVARRPRSGVPASRMEEAGAENGPHAAAVAARGQQQRRQRQEPQPPLFLKLSGSKAGRHRKPDAPLSPAGQAQA